MTLSGIPEFYGKIFQVFREESMAKIKSLGWDDLILLTKKKTGIFARQDNTSFYHHVSGMDHSTLSTFPAYFVSLLNLQEKKAPLEIEKGTCYIYNSFNQTDYLIEVKKTGQIKFFSFSKNREELSKIQDEIAYQLQLSSALRYFRGSTLLGRCLFGNSFWDTPCLRVISSIKLEYNDFTYIVNNHPITYELCESVARGLVFSLNKQEIKRFFAEFDNSHPYIMTSFLSYIPLTSSLFEFFEDEIKQHLENFPDDIGTTFVYVMYLMNQMHIQEARKYYTILQSTTFEEPLSCIACAFYCIFINKVDDAIYYLNCAPYAKKWDSRTLPIQYYDFTTPKQSLSQKPSPTEYSLYRTPIYGISFEYFSVVSYLCASMGYEQFSKKVAKFFHAKQVNQNIYYDITKRIDNSYQNSSDFHGILDSYDNLYDPGVISDPSPGEIKEFPPSKFFKDTFLFVNKCFTDRKSIISGKRTLGFTTQELILAIRIMDPQLFKIVKESMNLKLLTGLDHLLMIRALSLGLTKDAEQILNLNSAPQTQTEKNTLDWCIPFFKKLFFELTN